jgi:argininosuccinate lyase
MSDSRHRGGSLDINEAFRAGGRSVEFLDDINKASIVMLDERGLVPPAIAAAIARGIAEVVAQAADGDRARSADYLDYEPRLAAIVGADASRLHTGRSRQDIASTIARMNLRDALLAEHDALVVAREKLAALAGLHIETIVPAYTHGVQAQPTTFAHYLLAFSGTLARTTERMREAYARLNRSPLGAAALATSSFALDRRRLAEMLGFDGLIVNAYDANQLGPVDSALEIASLLGAAAITLGMFAQDIHAQYADAKPWIILTAGELTGVSSIMPQKRNPAALEQLRAQSSLLFGEMQTVSLVAHNNRTGMFDYRSYDPVPSARPLQVLGLFQKVIDGIIVDKARALAEVRADYSTTTEIADALMQKAEVPFRHGHHFASALTDYGRGRGLKLHEIPFAEAARIYREQTQSDLPFSESEFTRIMSPEHMVFGRKGVGGSQLAEVEHMLADERASIAGERRWGDERKSALNRAHAALGSAFLALATPRGDTPA